jgi:hypothetical protein
MPIQRPLTLMTLDNKPGISTLHHIHPFLDPIAPRKSDQGRNRDHGAAYGITGTNCWLLVSE